MNDKEMDDLFERSKWDSAIIVGSEVRQVIAEARRRGKRVEQLEGVIDKCIGAKRKRSKWSFLITLLTMFVILVALSLTAILAVNSKIAGQGYPPYAIELMQSLEITRYVVLSLFGGMVALLCFK